MLHICFVEWHLDKFEREPQCTEHASRCNHIEDNPNSAGHPAVADTFLPGLGKRKGQNLKDLKPRKQSEA